MSQFPHFARLFACVVFFAIVPTIALTQTAPEPLTKAKIIDGLTRGGISSTRMTTLVQERGVDFALTLEAEKALREAGADDPLILAISKVKVEPKTVLVIGTDADCVVSVNGASIDLRVGETKKVYVIPGENLIQATTKETRTRTWHEVLQFQQSEQKAVFVEFGLQSPHGGEATDGNKVQNLDSAPAHGNSTGPNLSNASRSPKTNPSGVRFFVLHTGLWVAHGWLIANSDGIQFRSEDGKHDFALPFNNIAKIVRDGSFPHKYAVHILMKNGKTFRFQSPGEHWETENQKIVDTLNKIRTQD